MRYPGEDFLGNLGGIHSFGILNALKTGDPKVDMIVALILPFALHYLLDIAKSLRKYFNYAYWKTWWAGKKHEDWHERTLSHSSQTNVNGAVLSVDNDSQNSVLMKAIRLYLHTNVDLNLKDADLSLTTMEDRSATPQRNMASSARTVVGILSKFKIVKNPPHNAWHNIGSFGSTNSTSPVLLKIDSSQTRKADSSSSNGNSSNDSGDKKVQTITYRFRSNSGNAIDSFIKRAYKWYLNELKKSEDNSRYYYELEAKSDFSFNADGNGRNNGGSTARRYTRFRLSNEKTFDSLFFQEKKPTLKLVDAFMKKTGKYAIKGYPHKLGLLLHGAPGTGKTSFIKALAEHTGRSVVNVPLSKISTNAELMSIFFDKTYWVQGQGVAIQLDFKDVIFVMEDIDAASDVVKRRDGKKTPEFIKTDTKALPPPKSLWRLLLESSDAESKQLVEYLKAKSLRLQNAANDSRVVHSVAKRMQTMPGLGFVGESNNDTLKKLGADAIKSGQTLLSQYAAVEKIVSAHARKIRSLLDDGAEIDDAFVDELLGTSNPAFPSMMKRPVSRETSYSNFEEKKMGDIVHMAQFESPWDCSSNGDSDKPKNGKGYMSMMEGATSYMSILRKDSLNLTGILNVLDGVVDTPSRIVIMTTNHPEHLDPALIRPGRIDKKLHLGNMAAPDLISMLEHYFETALTEKQRKQVSHAVSGDVTEKRPPLEVTPAQIEQLTAEFDAVDDMMEALEGRVTDSMPVTSTPDRTLGSLSFVTNSTSVFDIGATSDY